MQIHLSPKRPVCREPGCDVQVMDGQKYCDAHEWRVQEFLIHSSETFWLAKSRLQLLNAIHKAAA